MNLFWWLNVIDNNPRTIERNADVLLSACKGNSLAVNVGESKYMEVGHYQKMMPNEHIRAGSNLYKKVKTLRIQTLCWKIRILLTRK